MVDAPTDFSTFGDGDRASAGPGLVQARMARIRARHVCSATQLSALGRTFESGDASALRPGLLQIDRSARALKLFHLAALARDCERALGEDAFDEVRSRIAVLLAVLRSANADLR